MIEKDYYKMLLIGKIIDSDLCCSQSTRLKRAIEKKKPELIGRKKIVLHHDNARPHTSLATRQKLMDLSWKVLMRPSYSSDIAPLDYHLFRSLQKFS